MSSVMRSIPDVVIVPSTMLHVTLLVPRRRLLALRRPPLALRLIALQTRPMPCLSSLASHLAHLA